MLNTENALLILEIFWEIGLIELSLSKNILIELSLSNFKHILPSPYGVFFV